MATPITIIKQFGGDGSKGSIVNSGTIETATPITEILRPNI